MPYIFIFVGSTTKRRIYVGSGSVSKFLKPDPRIRKKLDRIRNTAPFHQIYK